MSSPDAPAASQPTSPSQERHFDEGKISTGSMVYVEAGQKIYSGYKHLLSQLLPQFSEDRFKGLRSPLYKISKRRKLRLPRFKPSLDPLVYSYVGSVAHLDREILSPELLLSGSLHHHDDVILVLLCAMSQLSVDNPEDIGQWLNPTTCDLVPRDETVTRFCKDFLSRVISVMYKLDNLQVDIAGDFNEANGTDLQWGEVALIMCLAKFDKISLLSLPNLRFTMSIPLTHMFVRALALTHVEWLPLHRFLEKSPNFLYRYREEGHEVLCFKNRREKTGPIVIKLDHTKFMKEMVISSYICQVMRMIVYSGEIGEITDRWIMDCTIEYARDESGHCFLCCTIDNLKIPQTMYQLDTLRLSGSTYEAQCCGTYEFVTLSFGLYLLMLRAINPEFVLPIEDAYYISHTSCKDRYDSTDSEEEDTYFNPSFLFTAKMPMTVEEIKEYHTMERQKEVGRKIRRKNSYKPRKVDDVISVICALVSHNMWSGSGHGCFDKFDIKTLFWNLPEMLTREDDILTGARYVAKILGFSDVYISPFLKPFDINDEICWRVFKEISHLKCVEEPLNKYDY